MKKIIEFRYRGGTTVLLSVFNPKVMNIGSDFDDECARNKIPRLLVRSLETIATDLTFDSKTRSRSLPSSRGN